MSWNFRKLNNKLIKFITLDLIHFIANMQSQECDQSFICILMDHLKLHIFGSFQISYVDRADKTMLERWYFEVSVICNIGFNLF